MFISISFDQSLIFLTRHNNTKTSLTKSQPAKWRVKQNINGEFNEAGKPKASVAKYSAEFNDLEVQTRLQ